MVIIWAMISLTELTEYAEKNQKLISVISRRDESPMGRRLQALRDTKKIHTIRHRIES